MIYNEHPGPWQTFLKRKDIIGLSPNEARKQYLIEQLGSNAAASAAAAAAAAGGNSSGGLVRTARIAANKGYATIPTLQKANIGGNQYETFYYGAPNKLNQDRYPTWELLVGKKRNSRQPPSPSDFIYGYCVYSEDIYSWFLYDANEVPDDWVPDPEDDTATFPSYIGGTGRNAWGEYTKTDGSSETITISPGLSSAFPTIYADIQVVGTNGGKLNKFYITPSTFNNAPVYYDPIEEYMLVYANLLDVDETFGGGVNAPQGLGWNVIGLGDNFFDDIDNLETENAPGSGLYSGSSNLVSTNINNPTGTATNTDSGNTFEFFTYTQSTFDFTGFNLRTFPLESNADEEPWASGHYDQAATPTNGRPRWNGRAATDTAPYSIFYDGTSWVLQKNDGVTYLRGDSEPFSPDGTMAGILGPGTNEPGKYSFISVQYASI